MQSDPVATAESAATLLADLVRIPSMAPGIEDGLGDAEVAAYVADFAAGLGAEVELQAVLPGRSNVLAWVRAGPDAPVLLLEAHMDTVGLGPMTGGLRPWIDDQARLHGRGACDTKGSLAAMMLALKWAERQSVRPCTLGLCAAVDEETSGAGAQAAAASSYRLDGVVVGEPTELQVVRAHRGGIGWWLTTEGVAAHSSQPELGDNAVLRMVDVLQVVRAEYDRRLVARLHPLTGRSTYSIGRIEGGAPSLNMVPDRCRVYVERRGNPDESLGSLCDEFHEILSVARTLLPGLRVASALHFAIPALDSAASDPLVQALATACEQTLGAVTVTGAPYGSDAAFFAVNGISSALFGPGDIAHAHSADEWVRIDDVVVAAEVYARAWLAFGEVHRA